MTYQRVLKESQKVGASKAKGLPWLAAVCWMLSHVHAINPQLVYEGARKKNLDGNAVRRLDPINLSNLMFE